MSQPQYKLTYFNIRGLAEIPRLLLHAANVPFTDERVTFEKKADGSFDRGDWDTVRKPKAPYGQMPILTLPDGTELAQSGAIIRYISTHHGLAGSNDSEAALIDAGFEALLDLRRSYHLFRDNATKVEAFWANGLNDGLKMFEKNVKGPFFIGNKMSYVDVVLYHLMFSLGTEKQEVVDKVVAGLPKVKAIIEGVAKNPQIAEWVAKRPQTIF